MALRSRASKSGSVIAAAACALVLAACSEPEETNRLAVPDKGHLLGDSENPTGLAAATPNGGGVNAYLWRGAIDVLSFMPFVSADPIGGVIITDWYTPPTVSGERFKATAYILGRELAANDVRVAVFRQVEQGGQWVDAPVAASTATDITDKVLARARELRAGTSG